MARTAPAAAELVKVRQAEAVRAVNDDGVGVRNVDAGFDDGGGQQDVRFPLHEGAHDLFQFFFRHLAVADDDAGLGHQGLDAVSEQFDGFHAVVQQENLSSALQLAFHGLFHDAFVVRAHACLDGLPVDGRGFNGAHVTCSHQGNVQGAGNGRGGQRQHVNSLEAFLEFFLVSDAEALFLVNDYQAQIFHGYVIGNEPVRAYDDVHSSRSEPFQRGADVRRAAEAAEHFNTYGVFAHAFLERAEMLFRQYGGGDQHGRLAASRHAFEGGADGNFRFSEAHVSADQAVHGAGGFHVRFRLGDGAELVLGFPEGKGAFKFPHPFAVRGVAVAFSCLAFRLDIEELGGVIRHGSFCGFFGALPFGVPQFVEFRRFASQAYVS